MLQERRSKLVESRTMMSPVTPAMTDPPAAARAGADLRAARERLGAPLQDVAHTLRIRLPQLEALEEGRLSLLPGNAYALAFVRTYASALGLDAEEMVRRFRTEADEFGRRTELTFLVPMPERGMPAGVVMLLGVVLAIGAYAGWYRLSGDGRLPAETVTAIPERLAPLAEQALPPPPGVLAPGILAPGSTTSASAPPVYAPPGAAADASSIAMARTAMSDPAAAGMQASPAPPVMAISRTSAAAAQLQSHLEDEPPITGLSPVAAAPITPDANRIVLRANADAWVMVKDRAGAILLNRVMRGGETWPVPPRSDLLLTAGNAGGMDVLVDGAPTPSLGGSGAVRRDMPLNPDQIKDGKLAGALAPQIALGRPRQ